MDIFIIETAIADKIDNEVLFSYKLKDILNESRLKEHCLAYMMIDRLLRDFYKIKDREIVFFDNKPYLAIRKKFFSISHSQGYVALAFSDNDCGIDIEKIKLRSFEDIAKRMGFKCETLEDFYDEWTKYEAEYKLKKTVGNSTKIKHEDYIITAVSTNPDETFKVYIQRLNGFSNAGG